MSLSVPARSRDLTPLRAAADRAFSRAGGAPLVAGNAVRVLIDAKDNYPAWEQAIRAATSTIHVEMYIIHRDEAGRRFVALLAERARAGVTVRLIYDWFGCGTGPLFGLFRPLVRAGGHVRVFNPPHIATALGWLRRDHRKLISIDGRVAYVSGLCVGQMWVGIPEKHRDPWRDTGVEIIGPAVAYAERAFAESWRLAGGEDIAPDGLPDDTAIAPAGSVSLRLIPTEPFTASMLRVDMLVTALARKSLWITDAYFLGHGPFVSALKQAALDGVDVRLLLPQGSDVGWTVPLSRTLYRTLLEAGIRIFEWNGSMVHAKTAVADGRWARVGSTNLNLNSWIGNWELDVAIEDESVARVLADRYEEDLSNATEILADGRTRTRAVGPRGHRVRRSARRVRHTMTGLGHSVGAAVTGNRPLEIYELAPLVFFGALLIAFAVLVWWQPVVIGDIVAVLVAWMGVSLIVDAWILRRQARRR